MAQPNFLWNRVLSAPIAELSQSEMPALESERGQLLYLGYRLVDARESLHKALVELAGTEWSNSLGQTFTVDVDPTQFDDTVGGCARLTAAIGRTDGYGLYLALTDGAESRAFIREVRRMELKRGLRFVLVS